MTESQILAAILREFGSRTDMRLWRQNTGAAKDPRTGQVIRFGIKGQADLSGILQGGRRIEIECKTATGRQTKEQKAWQRMIEKMGGLYVLARGVEDVERALQE